MEEERDDESLYPDDLLKIAKDPDHLGRMNDPSSSAYIKGPCGDEMEFYLVIDNGVIKDIAFYSEGCIATRICGEMTSKLAKGKRIEEVLDLSPKKVMGELNGLPADQKHCTILAVSTLYKAIAEYLLKP